MNKLLFILLFVTLSISAQNQNFETIDNHAKSIVYENNLDQLVQTLIAPCESQIEKARVIFIWITEHVSYDIKTYNNALKKPKQKKTKPCKTTEKCQNIKNAAIKKLNNKTLNTELAVCSGYAQLFKTMCDKAGVTSFVISGYTKTEPNEVGRMGSLNHAWNSLHINDSIYLIDPTWASGYAIASKNGTLIEYIKQYNNYYWLTPKEKFLINHFPEDSAWLKHYQQQKQRYKNGIFISGNHIENMEHIFPKSGLLKPKLGDTIQFSITSKDNFRKLQINTNIEKNPRIIPGKWNDKTMEKQQYITFTKTNNTYTFSHVVTHHNLRYIELLSDHKLILRWNIKVE